MSEGDLVESQSQGSYDSEIEVEMPLTQHVPERNDSSLDMGPGDSVSDKESEILLLSEQRKRENRQ